MDFEDFVHNRTTGEPSSIFKTLGDAAKVYSPKIDNTTVRTSNVPMLLANDRFESIPGLTSTKVQSFCVLRVFLTKVDDTKYSKVTLLAHKSFVPQILLKAHS